MSGVTKSPFLKKYSGLSLETSVTLFEVRMCNRFAVFNAQPNCLIDRFAEHTQTDENIISAKIMEYLWGSWWMNFWNEFFEPLMGTSLSK